MTESGKQTYRIAGLMYHIELSESECGKFDGFIEPEPSNPHDPDAMVIKKSDGRTVGYIQRKKVELFCLINGRRRIPCEITIRGRKEEGVLVYIDGYATPTTTSTALFSGAMPLGLGGKANPSGATPQKPRPAATQRPKHARTGQQEAAQATPRRNRERIPMDSGQHRTPDSGQHRATTGAQAKHPRRTPAATPRKPVLDNKQLEVSETRNISPLSPFERFLFLMIVAALLLVLAHLLS